MVAVTAAYTTQEEEEERRQVHLKRHTVRRCVDVFRDKGPTKAVVRLGLVQSPAISTHFQHPSSVDPTTDITNLVKELIKIAQPQSTAQQIDPTAQQMAALDILVLPEMWNTPYSTGLFSAFAIPLPDIGWRRRAAEEEEGGPPPACQPSDDVCSYLSTLASTGSMFVVGGSVAEEVKDMKTTICNTCMVFDPQGTLIAKHRKVHLFDINVPSTTTSSSSPSSSICFRESDTLSAGNAITTFTTPFGIVGVGICYDLRFPLLSAAMRHLRGVDLLIFPGAFNHVTGPAHWLALLRARAIDNQSVVVGCSLGVPQLAQTGCQVREEGDYPAYGHSCVVDAWGRVKCEMGGGVGVAYCEVDMAEVKHVRQVVPVGEQQRKDLYKLEEVVKSKDTNDV
eukprot:GHVS01008703.1.p1 GENE.GHVS01008703.1~~GHVS01008703.1.p1  ORF type:complete len:395 (+),score=104.38 GHVS01008703.1:1570-2754(+)